LNEFIQPAEHISDLLGHSYDPRCMVPAKCIIIHEDLGTCLLTKLLDVCSFCADQLTSNQGRHSTMENVFARLLANERGLQVSIFAIAGGNFHKPWHHLVQCIQHLMRFIRVQDEQSKGWLRKSFVALADPHTAPGVLLDLGARFALLADEIRRKGIRAKNLEGIFSGLAESDDGYTTAIAFTARLPAALALAFITLRVGLFSTI
jgi:hypothetical protein